MSLSRHEVLGTVTLNLSGELVFRIDAITDCEITPSEFARQAVEAIVARNEEENREAVLTSRTVLQGGVCDTGSRVTATTLEAASHRLRPAHMRPPESLQCLSHVLDRPRAHGSRLRPGV